MKPGSNAIWIKRLAACLLLAAMAAGLLCPAARAEEGRVVRVGWYESPFNITDQTGRRSGYAYDYQQKIAAYSGWSYEYVVASWPVLMQMLVDGEIDLLSDVSYTDERAENMLFSSLPMGTEEYFLFAAPDGAEISLDDYSTFKGKKVGVNKGSVQADCFREWAESNGVEATLLEMTETVAEAIDMLTRGEIDLYVMLDAYMDIQLAVPICKVGESDYYFAVSNACPELLPELNAAMGRIRDENPFYNQEMYDKYIRVKGANLYLSDEELDWLAGRGPIRVGYQDQYLPFCAQSDDGALTGALKDYLGAAKGCLENAELRFEAVPYSTVAEALDAMKRDEVDCVFPINLTAFDAEMQGVFITPTLMYSDVSAVVRAEEQKTFLQRKQVTAAVNQGNINYEMFLVNHYPEWRVEYCGDFEGCMRAVSEGKADCLLISSYLYNTITVPSEKYRLATISMNQEMEYCFAVKRGSTVLYSILSKVAGVVPVSTVNAALSYYYVEDAKVSLADLLRQNAATLTLVLSAVLLAFVALVVRSSLTARKAQVGQELISATETDALTGLYNKNYFIEYANRMHRDHPNWPMDAVVFNIDQFHAVNALNGWAFGDSVLRALGEELRAYLAEHDGIASHSEADRFALYCVHMADPRVLYDRLQSRLDALSTHADIRLRMGVMPWQEGMEPAQMIEQAIIACNLARGSYQERLIVFDEKLREREALKQRLQGDLRRALENREFVVFFQPKYDIQADPPRLVSAEALVRWQHPELGLIQPGEFIPLFERSGQIGLLDKTVWRETAAQIAAWRDRYGYVFPVSVNLSRIDMFDPDLESTLDGILIKNGLDCGALRLEVTESAYTENGEQVIQVIEGLHRKGFEIEMDDFGSGYSSLNMLSSMPVDVLKMDRMFIQDIEQEGKDLQLIELILDIARKLKVPVIAEGVETETQLRLLQRLGCAQVQGYYFSRPLPAEAFEAAYLREKPVG